MRAVQLVAAVVVVAVVVVAMVVVSNILGGLRLNIRKCWKRVGEDLKAATPHFASFVDAKKTTLVYMRRFVVTLEAETTSETQMNLIRC